MADGPRKEARSSGLSRCDWRAAICGSVQARQPKTWSLPGLHQLSHYIQDVAYSTKKLQMSTGEVLQIPNVVHIWFIDISFDVVSVVGTKLSNTGFVLYLLRSK